MNDRLKAIQDDPESRAEREALKTCLKLMDAESKAARAVKDAQAKLDETVLGKYGALTEDEIKGLVVADKWLASIRAAVDGEVERLTQGLAGRVKELEERYARPLPALEREVVILSNKVDEHLRKMGLTR